MCHDLYLNGENTEENGLYFKNMNWLDENTKSLKMPLFGVALPTTTMIWSKVGFLNVSRQAFFIFKVYQLLKMKIFEYCLKSFQLF